MTRLAVPLLLLAGAAIAERHAQVTDPKLARELKERYLAITDGWVKAATFTAAERAAMEAGRKWETVMTAGPDDPLAKKILAAGEPSFEALARSYPGKILDRAVLGTWSDSRAAATGYDDEFTVWWNGAIGADLFKGPLTDRLGYTGIQPLAHNTTVLFRVGADREMYGAAGESFSRIGYEDGWLPIVVSAYERGGIRYRQTAFADRPAGETGGWDIAYVRFELTNTGKSAPRRRVERGYPSHRRRPRARGTRPRAGRERRGAAGARRRVRRGGPASDAQTAAHPGPDHRGDFQDPLRSGFHARDPARHGARFRCGAHPRARFLASLLTSGANIRTPEPLLNDMWRALLVQNYILADGPKFTYGSGLRYNDSTYPQESNFGAHTFAMYGHKDYAGALQHYFVPASMEREKVGRKYQNRRAMALHHLLENWRLTGRTRCVRALPRGQLRVADEIVAERHCTMVETDGERPLHWGLLPPDKPGVDIQASTQRVYVLGHNITNCQGLRISACSSCAAANRRAARGSDISREAEEFRSRAPSAMERAAIRLPGPAAVRRSPDAVLPRHARLRSLALR